MDARGSVGKTLVFSIWKGINYVKRHSIPSNPKSAAQVSFRAMFTFLSQIWDGLTAGNKATWDTRADSLNVSPFNAFMAYSMSRWNHYKGPTIEYPAAEGDAGGDAPTTTPSAGVKEISLSIAHGAVSPDWGWVVHRSTSTGFTPSRSTAVAVIATAADPDVYLDAPLLTGVPYYYRIQGFGDEGTLGALEAERTATPT
jgi:hypothetical protein